MIPSQAISQKHMISLSVLFECSCRNGVLQNSSCRRSPQPNLPWLRRPFWNRKQLLKFMLYIWWENSSQNRGTSFRSLYQLNLGQYTTEIFLNTIPMRTSWGPWKYHCLKSSSKSLITFLYFSNLWNAVELSNIVMNVTRIVRNTTLLISIPCNETRMFWTSNNLVFGGTVP